MRNISLELSDTAKEKYTKRIENVQVDFEILAVSNSGVDVEIYVRDEDGDLIYEPHVQTLWMNDKFRLGGLSLHLQPNSC